METLERWASIYAVQDPLPSRKKQQSRDRSIVSPNPT